MNGIIYVMFILSISVISVAENESTINHNVDGKNST